MRKKGRLTSGLRRSLIVLIRMELMLLVTLLLATTDLSESRPIICAKNVDSMVSDALRHSKGTNMTSLSSLSKTLSKQFIWKYMATRRLKTSNIEAFMTKRRGHERPIAKTKTAIINEDGIPPFFYFKEKERYY